MLGQQIAAPILLPMAVTVLAEDPLAEGDYYPGDLLHNVVRLSEPDWHGAEGLRDRLVEILRATPLPDHGIPADLRHAVGQFLRQPKIKRHKPSA